MRKGERSRSSWDKRVWTDLMKDGESRDRAEYQWNAIQGMLFNGFSIM